jgi:TetR/AcrR family transcriptional regulator, cholesterol catabolism regulator
MPKGIPLTAEELDRRRHEIFSASVHLFLEKGFQETSMQEIARAAGMGKSSLYDYFKTKDDILVSVVEDELYDLGERARIIASQDLPAVERLRQVMRAHLEYLLENKEFYTTLLVEVQRLGLEAQRRLQVKRHVYQDLLCDLVEKGIQEGTFRPVTPLLAARTILSLFTPAVFTSRPTGTPEQMMDETIDIFFRGVQA